MGIQFVGCSLQRYRLVFPSSDGTQWIESFLTVDTPNGKTLDEILKLLDTPCDQILGSNCHSKSVPAVRNWAWRLVET